MEIERVYAVYFSPTHGTRRYVEGLAARLGGEYEVIDLTRPAVRAREWVFGPKDLVIFGAPVYAGRLPEVPGGLLDRVRGDRTPAVFTVSYGNRDYDDALLEELDLCESRGFVGVAAAAWIAPHTFSDKLGAGRPDGSDEAAMDRFAALVREVLARDGLPPLAVKGDRPYKERKVSSGCPVGGEGYTGCGACAALCPVGAIDPARPRETDRAGCLGCLACVKSCPAGARAVPGDALPALRKRLEDSFLEPRKEPEWFLP